jgi:hypothetical protein
MDNAKAVRILNALIDINHGAIRRLGMKRSYTAEERKAAVQIVKDDNEALALAIDSLNGVVHLPKAKP